MAGASGGSGYLLPPLGQNFRKREEAGRVGVETAGCPWSGPCPWRCPLGPGLRPAPGEQRFPEEPDVGKRRLAWPPASSSPVLGSRRQSGTWQTHGSPSPGRPSPEILSDCVRTIRPVNACHRIPALPTGPFSAFNRCLLLASPGGGPGGGQDPPRRRQQWAQCAPHRGGTAGSFDPDFKGNQLFVNYKTQPSR